MMGLEAFALAALAAGMYPGEPSIDDALLNSSYFRMMLYNDSPEAWNARTRSQYNADPKPLAASGACSVAAAGPPGVGIYPGRIDSAENLILDGVGLEAGVFTRCSGALHITEPQYYERDRNITWVGAGMAEATVGVGCATRTVNGSWDNTNPSRPGGGMHREYLLPVEAETVVAVNGRVRMNATRLLGKGYPASVQYLAMLQANFSSEGMSSADVNLSHTCRGRILLDSAYQVMGWRRVCRREYYVEKICLPNCGHANARCGKTGCAEVDCAARCSQIADRICREYSSGKAVCDTPPGGEYGSPEDGSSDYFIRKPEDSSNDPCMCRHVWDPSNACVNNRVTLAASEAGLCRDSAEYAVRLHPRLSCNGSYRMSGGISSGTLTFVIEPDLATAFTAAGVLYRFKTLEARHVLYRRLYGEGPPVLEYGIAEDFGLNESSNRSGYFDFAFLETVDNPTPPTIGEGFIVSGYGAWNGTYNVSFVSFGDPSNVTFAVYTLGDRASAAGRPACGLRSPCVGGYCLDGVCVGLTDALNRTLRLGDCLTLERETSLSFVAPREAEAGMEFTAEARLASHLAPLQGFQVTVVCGGWEPVEPTLTDSAGAASYRIRAGGSTASCTASFHGGGGYAPSRAMRLVKVAGGGFGLGRWILLLSPLLLLAFAYTLASGDWTLHGFVESVRRLMR